MFPAAHSVMRQFVKTPLTIALVLTCLVGSPARARDDDPTGPTPPRLGFIDGDVSYWRPGAEDWVPAQVNTALAAGDEVYAAEHANVELQVGPRAFVRAGSDTQVGLEALDSDHMQYKVTGGHAAFDLKTLPRGTSIELDTPSAAFEMNRPGYYRVDVDDNRTVFSARRGGVATVTPIRGEAADIGDGEQVVLAVEQNVLAASDGGAPFQVGRAPDLDDWDRWNYDRTSSFGDAPRSAQYVPRDVAGVDDLDRYGDWREESRYGRVWMPRDVAPDWSPYSTGRWTYDPYYEWTWVDDAPWGWAPYHYGRWVHVNSVWAWAPGPVVVRPVYAPALVAFFGAPGIRVAIGAPFVSWVALGWGEPCVPWWGRPGFVGRAWWGGWGGPRVVNNVVVNRTTVVNVRNITVYRNVGVQNAVVAVRPDRFGRGAVADARIRQVDTRRLEPVRGAVDLRPDRASFAAASGRAVHPPDSVLARPVVATRAPVTRALPHEPEGRGPAPHIVSAPRGGEPGARPSFGDSRLERARPPQAPRFDTNRRPDTTPPPARGPEARPGSPRTRGADPAPRPEAPRPDAARAPEPARAPQAPAVEASRPPRPQPAPATRAPEVHPQSRRGPERATPPRAPEAVRPQPPAPGGGARPAAPAPHQAPPPRTLPGQPANRLFPGGRVERPTPRAPESRPPASARPAAPQSGGHERGPARDRR